MDLEDGKRMLGDLKSKLGFGSKNQEPEYDEYYDEGYEEYADDYDGYDDYAASEDDGYGSYDDYAPRSGRSSSYASESYRSTPRGRATSPRLVSMDDVRASTRVPASLERDPLPARAPRTSGFDSGRTMVDSSLPPQMTPEGTAAEAAAATRRRSEGLDSLFSSTTEAPAVTPRAAASAQRSAAYDPYEVYSGAHSAGYSAARGLKVIKPMSYAEVEGIARALKAGDAVALGLGNTPDALSKRILDFSFGVASALDASVDAVANKVFVITKGGELTDAERMSLRNQGVL